MGDNAAIWGAGKFGRYVYDILRVRKDIGVRCFLDKNPDISDLKIDGIDICLPEQLQHNHELKVDYVLISFLGGIGIYDQLSQFGNIRFGIVKDQVFLERLGFKDKLEDDSNIFWISDADRPLLRHLETNIVDCCNLNCKGCSHFSNLYHKGERIPFETYCRDLKLISEKVNVLQYSLLGGEALLNDRIIDYMNSTREILPYSDIRIVTNGLLLPKQKEEFFVCCVENNITIEISEYPPTSRMKNQIISILEQYKIVYRFRKDINMFMKNIDLSGEADRNSAMQNCLQTGCVFFRSGKLYKCPFEALGNKLFEYFELDIRLQGGTDIYDEGLNWKKIVYHYENETVDACRYCGKGKWFPWEYSHNPSLDEWIIG